MPACRSLGKSDHACTFSVLLKIKFLQAFHMWHWGFLVVSQETGWSVWFCGHCSLLHLPVVDAWLLWCSCLYLFWSFLWYCLIWPLIYQPERSFCVAQRQVIVLYLNVTAPLCGSHRIVKPWLSHLRWVPYFSHCLRCIARHSQPVAMQQTRPWF